jgi:hypothetical protein
MRRTYGRPSQAKHKDSVLAAVDTQADTQAGEALDHDLGVVGKENTGKPRLPHGQTSGQQRSIGLALGPRHRDHTVWWRRQRCEDQRIGELARRHASFRVVGW